MHWPVQLTEHGEADWEKLENQDWQMDRLWDIKFDVEMSPGA